jgi:hypothetical protein
MSRITHGQAPRPDPVWAEEESEINIRRDNSELLGATGGNFWRSIWKRIERSDARDERTEQAPEMSLQAPRDYVVETDNQAHSRPS